MNKNLLIGLLTAVLVVTLGTAALNVSGVLAGGITPNNTAAQGFGGQGKGQGQSGSSQAGSATNIMAIPAAELSAEESAALIFMAEEEKLARDVYNALYASWNLPVFQNIAGSEQVHMDEISLLLTRYNLPTPSLAAGVFNDPKLQSLYNTLVAQGKQSISAALKVGGAIEEIDILDLQTRLAQTDNADIQLVYNNLMKGSYNHLKAFSNTLSSQTGETYAPQSMSADQYQTIINNAASGGGRPSWAGKGAGRP